MDPNPTAPIWKLVAAVDDEVTIVEQMSPPAKKLQPDESLAATADPKLASSSADPKIATSADPKIAASADPKIAASADPKVAAPADPEIPASTDPKIAASADPKLAAPADPNIAASADSKLAKYKAYLKRQSQIIVSLQKKMARLQQSEQDKQQTIDQYNNLIAMRDMEIKRLVCENDNIGRRSTRAELNLRSSLMHIAAIKDKMEQEILMLQKQA
jgi:hypothetical protein